MANKNRITKPIVNVMSPEEKKKWGYMMSLISEEHDDLVRVHKNLFGQQSYCWAGQESRHWVWELGGCRVYVSNTKGIAFEVESDHDRETAIQNWKKYLSQWDCLELDENDTFEEKAVRRAEEQATSNEN